MKLVDKPFSEIPYGRWFRDGHGRRMIRIRPVGDCALLSRLGPYMKLVMIYQDGTEDPYRKELNAIDDQGIPCRCPDWVTFYVEEAGETDGADPG